MVTAAFTICAFATLLAYKLFVIPGKMKEEKDVAHSSEKNSLELKIAALEKRIYSESDRVNLQKSLKRLQERAEDLKSKYCPQFFESRGHIMQMIGAGSPKVAEARRELSQWIGDCCRELKGTQWFHFFEDEDEVDVSSLDNYEIPKEIDKRYSRLSDVIEEIKQRDVYTQGSRTS